METLEQANARLLERKAKLDTQRQSAGPQKLKESSVNTSPSEISIEFAAKYEADRLAHFAEVERNEARRQEAEALDSLRRRFSRARIPARHADRQLDGAPEWEATLAGIQAKLGTGFLIALLGIRGAGKTQLAVEAIRSQVEGGREGRYVKAMDLIIRFREAFRKDGPSEKAVLEEFLNPDILVVDAMEERGETPFEDRMISHLIDLRYDAMLDTILISNQTKEAFAKSIGDSAVSRIIETGTAIECTWESFRKKVAA